MAFTLIIFVQPFADNTNIYVTAIGAVVVFVKTSETLPLPAPAILLIPVTAALVHVKEAPLVALVGI